MMNTETQAAEQDKLDGQQPTLKPSLTGDPMLDTILEKLRRTLERRKKQPSDQHQPGERSTITELDDSSERKA
jgi:hypothetical protein